MAVMSSLHIARSSCAATLHRRLTRLCYMMQAACLSSDLVLTVSEAYAKETCQDTELSYGLHSILAGTAVK